MKTIKKGVFIFIALIYAQNAFAQIEKPIQSENNKFNRFYIGLNGGTMVGFTNIKQQDFIPVSGEWRFGVGAVVGYQVSPILGLQGQFIYGELAGKKTNWRNGATANLKFNSNITEYGVNATVSLNKWLTPHLKINEKLDFYGLIGFGFIAFRSKLETLDQGVFVASRGYSNNGNTKDGRIIQAVFPIGIGMKYRITEKIFMNLETNLRNTNSDKLDAFERQYNPRDKYSYTHIGVHYIFGKNEKSLTWVNMMDYQNLNNPIIAEQKATLDSLKRDNDKRNQFNLDSLVATKVTPINNRIDGLERKIDSLPTKMDNKGDANNVSSLLPSIYFEFGKATVTPKNEMRLAMIAVYLQKNPNINIRLISHTDKTGNTTVNKKISKLRVDKVYDILVNDYKIDAKRLEKDSKSNSEMLSKNKNYINRRVDFVITN